MDQEEEAHKLEREIERVKRLAAGVLDRTTSQRLWDFVEELRQRLHQRRAARLPARGGKRRLSGRGSV
jgi:hypothetical protein